MSKQINVIHMHTTRLYITPHKNNTTWEKSRMDQLQGKDIASILLPYQTGLAQNSMLVASLCLKQFGLLSPSWSTENLHHHHHHRHWPQSLMGQEHPTTSAAASILMPQSSHQSSSTSTLNRFEAKTEEPKFNFHKLAESATKDKIKKKSRPKKEYICR